MEYLNPQPMHQISLKKESASEDNFVSPVNNFSIPKASVLNFANRSTISFSLSSEANFSRIMVFSAKGATVWQKNLGSLSVGTSSIGWNGENLPAGSYIARLETGSSVLAYKFELR
jgi:hypothetical protein